jgi:spore germination protein Q
LYYVNNDNHDYRDQDHPYTFVFVNPGMTPGVAPAAMQPGMAPQYLPQMTPQYLPQAGMSSAPPASVVNPPIASGSQLPPMIGDVGLGGMGGFGGMGTGGMGGMAGGGAGAGGGGAEESYIENIIRFNRGKIATFYMTFENNNQWNARVFRGRVETAGRDHIIVSDPQTGKRFILLMINLDWIEFDGPVSYIPPTLPPGVQAGLATDAGAGPASPREDE